MKNIILVFVLLLILFWLGSLEERMIDSQRTINELQTYVEVLRTQVNQLEKGL